MTLELTCLQPHFEYDFFWRWWKACTACGRPAWSHEQADPIQDVRNFVERARRGEEWLIEAVLADPPAMWPSHLCTGADHEHVTDAASKDGCIRIHACRTCRRRWTIRTEDPTS